VAADDLTKERREMWNAFMGTIKANR